MFRREGSLDEYPEVLPSGLIAVPVKFTEVSMFKLCIYVPSSHLEIVKSAIFTAGAGTISAYSHCSWEVKGLGQFKPGVGAQPFVGAVDRLEQVVEYRLETIVTEAKVVEVVAALRKAHPYEEPAYDVIKLEPY